MTSGNSSIVWVILQAGSNLFNLPLPGASVLIPDFLREIDQLFRFDNKMPPPEAVQHKVCVCAPLCVSLRTRVSSRNGIRRAGMFVSA